jgi:hypothetical protein
MKSTTSSSVGLSYLGDYYHKSSLLRAKIAKNEQQRVQLDEKLRCLTNVDTRLQQSQQIDRVQAFLTRLDRESQHAQQRHMKLLNDLAHARSTLDQIRIDANRLIRLKYEHQQNNNQETKAVSGLVRDNTIVAYDFDHSRSKSLLNNEREHVDDGHFSSMDHTSTDLSRSHRSSSLRMDLTRAGLMFLLDYIEQQLIDTIDNKKFYQHDSPTLPLKRTTLDIANRQQHDALKELDPTTTSAIVLDQLPATIRRITDKQCLLTADILTANIKDLDVTSIGHLLSSNDRTVWIRLIDHLNKLYKYHIMPADILANKFAPAMLSTTDQHILDKAKSLVKHVVEQSLARPLSSVGSEDESRTKSSKVNQSVKANSKSTSAWLKKLSTSRTIDDDDDLSSSSSSSLARTSNRKSFDSRSTTPKKPAEPDDTDLDFYS